MVLFLRVRNIKISRDFQKKQEKTRLNKTLSMYLSFFVILAGITLSRSFMRGALTSFLPTYLNIEKGKGLWISGISLSIIQLAGAAGTFLAGSISDKIGRKTTLLIIAAASPVFMVFFLIVKGVLVIPLLVLLGFSLTAATPVLLALVQDLDSDRPAFMNSILMTINFFLAAVGILVVGMLGDWLGLENTYWISVVLALAALPFILKLERAKGK
jgi:FSR family fosmidomycin resistance protein-like MFS transporter